MNYEEPSWDDTRCYHCGAELSPDPQPKEIDSYSGFCSRRCRHEDLRRRCRRCLDAPSEAYAYAEARALSCDLQLREDVAVVTGSRWARETIPVPSLAQLTPEQRGELRRRFIARLLNARRGRA